MFAIRTDGTGFTSLHHFTGPSDGAGPQTALVLSGNLLYGIANNGGTSGCGTVFVLGTNGAKFTTLYNFPRPEGEAQQFYSDLTLASGTFYGTTLMHGSAGNGTVFGFSFPPEMTITSAGASTIVSWPTDYAGFDYTGFTLQSATNLSSPLWVTTFTPPVVVGGRNIVTNPVSSAPQFFRLRQQSP